MGEGRVEGGAAPSITLTWHHGNRSQGNRGGGCWEGRMGGNPWERATQIKPGQRQESINGGAEER